MTTTTEKIRAARLAACQRAPYLSHGIHSMALVPSSDCPTMGVSADWRCYYNPAAVDGWPVAEVAAVLVHELMHLLREHHARRGSADPLAWNIATDAEINDDIRAMPGLSLPDGAVYPSALGKPDGLTAEAYLPAAEQAAGKKPEPGESDGEGQPGDGDGDGQPGGSCADGQRRPWEAKTGDPAGPDGAEGKGPTEGKLTARKVAEDIQAAAARGEVPGGLARMAAGILAPPVVDWRRELAAMVRAALAHQAGAVDYSYRRRSRSSCAVKPAILPGLVAPRVKVAVVIDTSGSMRQEDLRAALGEVRGVLRALPGDAVQVLTCDAAAGPVQSVFDARRVRLTGGGGTDMGVGLQAAATLKSRPDVIVCLTDGITPWPASAPSRARHVVCILGGRASGYPAPAWARVLYTDPAARAADAVGGRA